MRQESQRLVAAAFCRTDCRDIDDTDNPSGQRIAGSVAWRAFDQQVMTALIVHADTIGQCCVQLQVKNIFPAKRLIDRLINRLWCLQDRQRIG